MKIGIIGAGAIGSTLARGLAKAGHQVSIANSRGPETLKELAAEFGATAVPAREAARAGDVVILSIPQKAVAQLPKDLGDPPEARTVARRLIDELGFDPVDAGPLDESWRQQPGTPAYCRDLDSASLTRALAGADRRRLAEYRREREEHVAKLTAKGAA